MNLYVCTVMCLCEFVCVQSCVHVNLYVCTVMCLCEFVCLYSHVFV